jgi:signal transduction histidine kinase
MLGKPLPPAQKLLVVFALTIFVPGLLLAVFGARALWQERRGAEQRLQDRLDHGAEIAGRTLANELSRLQSIVDGAGLGLPFENAFRDLPADGWAYVERRGSMIQVYPPNALPYELQASAAPLDPEISLAEKLEMQEGDARKAVARYRDLLTRTQSSSVSEVKHRLARALRGAGNTREATRLWREVENTGGRIGSRPASLVAGFELASADNTALKDFCRHLAEGGWRLEKVAYVYYSTETCSRPVESPLADAVESALASPSRLLGAPENKHTPYLSFRREDPPGALVVSPSFLEKQVWPRVLKSLDAEIHVSRIAAEDQPVYSGPEEPSAFLGAASLKDGGLSWTIEVMPRDAEGFFAAMNRTTNLYFAMLSMVVVLLAAGGYVIARTVRRELEVARMKSEFVSAVSHEFRSPLTGIRQLGEMLARDRVAGEDKRHQYYDLILHESERLTRLVENALDFARMEEGRKPWHFQALDTSAWLNGIADEFRWTAERQGYTLETSIPENLPPVHGDREALSTAVRNLLDNACKYSPQSKTVWMNAESLRGGVRVDVRDRGMGISAQDRKQIFEKFYRGREVAQRVKGAGLGLSLVQHIVAAHHGTIAVDSSEGEGSTFSIHLPGTS